MSNTSPTYSTRQRKPMSSPMSGKAGSSSDSTTSNKHALPPKREGKAIRRVRWPLMDTKLSNIIYYLAAIGLLFTVYYTYRIVQWKTDAGGWWNFALGKRPPRMGHSQGMMSSGNGDDMLVSTPEGVPQARTPEMDLEFHISAIASILDIRPTDLASALSSAVHDYVPPKSLSSLSSSASAENAEKTAIEAFFGGDEEINEKKPGVAAKMGNVAKAVLDTDPAEELLGQ